MIAAAIIPASIDTIKKIMMMLEMILLVLRLFIFIIYFTPFIIYYDIGPLTLKERL